MHRMQTDFCYLPEDGMESLVDGMQAATVMWLRNDAFDDTVDSEPDETTALMWEERQKVKAKKKGAKKSSSKSPE